MRAEARYPSEIKSGLLFLGNMISILDKNNEQLRKLGIKTIVYLAPDKFEHLENNQDFTCHHFEVKEHEKPIFDIDVVAGLILNVIKEQTGPVFIFDISGILSAAVCVKFMIESNRAWSKEIATAFIINKRYEAKDMPSWLY